MFLPPIKSPFPQAPIIPAPISITREILIIVHMIIHIGQTVDNRHRHRHRHRHQ